MGILLSAHADRVIRSLDGAAGPDEELTHSRYSGNMPHVFEAAPSGRSKCRGCGATIAKGEVRFGERMPNPYADGDDAQMTLWFHPLCAAYKRPEAMLETLVAGAEIADRAVLERAAQASNEQKRLQRIDGAEISKSGQATCRHCREPIAKGGWRVRLVFYEEGRFNPSGYIHLACAKPYFETEADIADHLLHFSRDLAADDREALRGALS